MELILSCDIHVIEGMATAESVVEAAIDGGALSLGYEKLKEDQHRVIKPFIQGNDVFASLPTGYGKSLCYFCLPAIFDRLNHHTSPWSVVIVISPLQALMKDQVQSLERKGVRAVSVIGHDSEDEDTLTKQQIVSGEYQIILTTPELLLTNKNWRDVFQSPSLQERLVAVVVDEAHCVKKW